MEHTLRLTPAEKVEAILPVLDRHYPEAKCTLNFSNPLELLVATILSAQCTDERVNQITPGLFKRYPGAESFATAKLSELEARIRPTGFFRNKAKNIRECCRILVERFSGQVPADFATLVQLPGIGRKSANVILANAYQIPGIAVDTHVGRVAQRLGLTTHRDPGKIEKDLVKLIPTSRWILFSHQLIQHGRRICLAQRPKCAECPLREHSEYAREKGYNIP
ncbi:MAG: endonuclease III [Desulforhabdus sp.]|jgi:endonuclease-3|nr:endonuclease III [Desulforhabdus sp.]